MKVIFIDTVHPILKERLEAKGIRCVMHHRTSAHELAQLIGNYDGIVIRSRIPMNKQFLSKATQLKFIARSGAGLENIDLDYCRSRGIVCFNSPEGNRDAVGEHALGMLLSLFNNLFQSDKEVRSGEWNREKNRGIELTGKTVGIIGYGNMGSAFAKNYQALTAGSLRMINTGRGFQKTILKKARSKPSMKTRRSSVFISR